MNPFGPSALPGASADDDDADTAPPRRNPAAPPSKSCGCQSPPAPMGDGWGMVAKVAIAGGALYAVSRVWR